MVAGATIAMPNGRVNGYQLRAPDGESAVLHDAQVLVGTPVLHPASEKKTGPSAAQTNHDVKAQLQPTAVAAEQVKPEQKKAEVKSPPQAKTQVSKPAAKKAPPNPGIKYVPQSGLDRDLARLEQLSRAALAGDTTALDALRAALDCCPHIWRRLADLEHLVELKLMVLVAGNDPLRSEAFRKRCSELRHHLLDGQPSSLATKMAASRLTITWLFVQFLELRALESPEALHSIRQLEQAERRYQVAMRTFGMAKQMDARLRRLGQLNN